MTFDALARTMTEWAGRWPVVVGAFGVVLAWALSGPLFGFSQGWQMVINTGTTIITFLMVFLIQNTQNRDTQAIQTKLDELLRAIPQARDDLRGIERAEGEG
jgi:low affinity Fe/Cu permease